MMIKLLILLSFIAGPALAEDFDLEVDEVAAEVMMAERIAEEEVGREIAHKDKVTRNCEEVTCDDVSKEKQDCIIKSRCNPIIRKHKKRIAELEKEVAYLRAHPITDTKIVYQRICTLPRSSTSVSLLVGESKSRLGVKDYGGVLGIEKRNENAVGIQFAHDLDEDTLFLIQGMSSEDWAVGLGWRF